MGNGREARLRALMSQEAARLIVDEGVSDFQTAKRKAAERLKLSEHQLLPRNSEIEEAVRARQRLFQEGPHEQHLRNLRLSAVRAMILLKEFSPRLTGSVLSGTAGPHSDINLHLFADTPEDVILRLMALEIPHRNLEKRLRMRPDSAPEPFPCIRFSAGDHEVELVILVRVGERQAPLSPVDGRPMPRADLEKLQLLLAAPESDRRV